MTKERYRLRNDLRPYVYISGSSLEQRHVTTIQRNKQTYKKKKKTTENPREGEESDFQICHIRFKCQVFKKKKSQGT